MTYLDIRGGMKLDPKVGALSVDAFEAIYAEWLAACEEA